MTFAPGELEAEIRRIGKLSDDAAVCLPSMPVASANATDTGGGRGRLMKELNVAVTYPDGTSGSCYYRRMGPSCHLFEYGYQDGAMLSRQYVMTPLENTPTATEHRARESVGQAFQEAILWERKDRFCRVSEPSDGSRKRDPSRQQMTPKAAKEQAGKYAVCQRLGENERLLPVSSLFETIEEANDAWVGLGHAEWVVACCNRLDRCWSIPKYNPMPRGERSEGEEESNVDAAVIV